MSIAIRELKSGLSRMLLRAQAGEIIEITSHNKPIARIIGIPQQTGDGLRDLIIHGALSWSGGKPQLQPPLGIEARGTSVSRMVMENRD
ncbi:type II toxin-antitoxin system prevent-host-death family antitoxin [Propionivibrio sp.]|uniref:type II toxin-antitoxin system Phd/YefM family antitoxin n=1 Tax=Propionivibrio sp. TaxID=2212460 RepID=UPI002629B6EE|nr:type II toxin-antitoxin system prevent-host-death family antitoxin [Propionivibrio sp.]